MRYLCAVYIDPGLFDAMGPEEADRLDDEDLERSGHLILAQALEHPHTAVTLRRRDGRLSMTDGPFAETHEHLGGFFYIEARDLNEALDIAARSPLTRVGAVEVRPTFDVMQKIRDRPPRDA
jgi:hypothetical protein